ncbi:MAG: hemerythrin domain-containing protein [Elusimicrobiota bacterium]
MKKATDSLLNDHKMIRKLLEGFQIDNPRFPEIANTLNRVVLTHAWFEDTVFLPVFKTKPLFVKKYLDELYEEHKDIEFFLKLIKKTALDAPQELNAYIKQFRAIMDNHLKKEEDALFPLAETILTNEGMNQLSSEMEKHQSQAQKLFNS